LQRDISSDQRTDTGLEEVFREVFPLESYDGQIRLEYIGYTLGKEKYSRYECQRRGMTYSAPLKVKLRLVTPVDIKEQEVLMLKQMADDAKKEAEEIRLKELAKEQELLQLKQQTEQVQKESEEVKAKVAEQTEVLELIKLKEEKRQEIIKELKSLEGKWFSRKRKKDIYKALENLDSEQTETTEQKTKVLSLEQNLERKNTLIAELQALQGKLFVGGKRAKILQELQSIS
jgi:hypothetical protein